MRLLLLAAVFAVGFLQPVQAGLNATTAKAVGSRFQAGWVNGAVNVVILTTILLVMGLRTGSGLPGIDSLRTVPWWAYLAGIIGASVVVVHLTAAPQLGAGLLVAIFVGGMVAGSLACDFWGFPGYSAIRIEGPRLLGLGLVAVGAVLVARPWAT
jgi:transporter family-2 protein